MAKHFLFIIFSLPVLLGSCIFPRKDSSSAEAEKNRSAMIKADEDFSALSAKKGMKAAFLEYIDGEGVLLRPDALPIAGADAVDYLIASNDTGYSMTWKPKSGMVAASGELGYTYGLYEIRPVGKDTILYGTYINIWKKQDDGKWKFVLDSGNEGIGE